MKKKRIATVLINAGGLPYLLQEEIKSEAGSLNGKDFHDEVAEIEIDNPDGTLTNYYMLGAYDEQRNMMYWTYLRHEDVDISDYIGG